MIEQLTSLEPGQTIIFGGDRTTTVPPELAAAFVAGDRLIVVNDTGALLHIPAQEWETATTAVGRASEAFLQVGALNDQAITNFFDVFARRLADEQIFAPIAQANAADVAQAKQRGRSTTRLVLSEGMRADMIAGLEAWRDAPTTRDSVIETVEHEGWRVEQRIAGLGVVGFVFEGRPNVFADACGVLRSGNAVVFRIGSDALGTAKAIVEHALDPALAEAGLPPGLASLVPSAAHAAGWALFSDQRLALAVARGSGQAVNQLGSVARQAGTSVSLHGTGGAWIITGEGADAARLTAVVSASLDRKVCNTLNTCVVLANRAEELVPAALAGLQDAADRLGVNGKLHVAEGSESLIPPEMFHEVVPIGRAGGDVPEPRAETIGRDQLGHEWEWETSPEVTLVIVDSVEEAIGLFNQQSPRFVVSLISDIQVEQDRFWAGVDAPFVGDGFTRWVDGQYALNKPELGLSNWDFGRLFSRGGVLAGDSVFTVRSRVIQERADLRR